MNVEDLAVYDVERIRDEARASSARKAAAGEWPDSGVLPLEDLFIDSSYQRGPTDIARRIVAGFDPLLLDHLLVSERSSKRKGSRYAVVDGQSRRAALLELGYRDAPCRILRGLSVPREALLFADLQRQRRNIKPYDRHRALVVGRDQRAVDLQRALDARNIELSGATSRAIHITGAIGTLERIYDRDGADGVGYVLDAIDEAWPDGNGRWAAATIGGVAYFVSHDAPDRARLVAALQRIGSPSELSLRAGELRDGRGYGGSSHGYAEQAIRLEYTRRRTARPRNAPETSATAR